MYTTTQMGEAVLLRVDLIFVEVAQQQALPVLGRITHYQDLQKHLGPAPLPLQREPVLEFILIFIYKRTGL